MSRRGMGSKDDPTHPRSVVDGVWTGGALHGRAKASLSSWGKDLGREDEGGLARGREGGWGLEGPCVCPAPAGGPWGPRDSEGRVAGPDVSLRVEGEVPGGMTRPWSGTGVTERGERGRKREGGQAGCGSQARGGERWREVARARRATLSPCLARGWPGAPVARGIYRSTGEWRRPCVSVCRWLRAGGRHLLRRPTTLPRRLPAHAPPDVLF